jgi:hypothetical protein
MIDVEGVEKHSGLRIYTRSIGVVQVVCRPYCEIDLCVFLLVA